jgi:hypothetical protein
VFPFQVPFLIMCCAYESSTRVSILPFGTFTEGTRKLAPAI